MNDGVAKTVCVCCYWSSMSLAVARRKEGASLRWVAGVVEMTFTQVRFCIVAFEKGYDGIIIRHRRQTGDQ
jgi:hypothetical protein